jgi:hypothetical protein
MSLRYRIVLSENTVTFTISLPICIHFISSSCLIVLARNSRGMLNGSGENRDPCLVPHFGENDFNFYPLSIEPLQC